MNITATQPHVQTNSGATLASPMGSDYDNTDAVTLQYLSEYPIIREFLLLRHQRNGGGISESPTPRHDAASGVSASVQSSEVSALSLRTRGHPPTPETPPSESNSLTAQGDDALQMISLPMTIFRPIHSVESAESLSRSGSYIPVPAPMRGSSVLTRFRRLVEDLEVSQGIRLARVVGISSDSQKPREEEYAGDSDDYDTNESSFTESMLAVDECITTGGPPDLVKWLAGQFKKSKKSRHVSIDGLIMSHGVSESFQNVGVAHGLSRWKPFKLQDMRRQSTQTNVITRVFNHWRISRSADPVVVSTFIINRSPGDRLSGIF